MVNGKKEGNTTAKVTKALAVVSQYCQKGDYASVQNLCHTLAVGSRRALVCLFIVYLYCL
jgi:hypothetical protein